MLIPGGQPGGGGAWAQVELTDALTERRRRQVVPGCLFWVFVNSVQFYLSRQLTPETHGIVESKEKRELRTHLLDSETDYIKIMRHV